MGSNKQKLKLTKLKAEIEKKKKRKPLKWLNWLGFS